MAIVCDDNSNECENNEELGKQKTIKVSSNLHGLFFLF